MRKNSKKIIFLIIKIIAIALPLFLIFKQVEFSKLGPTIQKVQWWAVPILLGTALAMTFFQGIRWWILIRAFTKKLSFLYSIAYHFSSIFYSLIIPNSISQDIIRTVLATKKAGSIISWSSTWIAKITGIFVSLGFSLYGLIHLSNSGLSQSINIIIIALFSILILGFIFSFSKRCSRILRYILIPIIPKRFHNWLEMLREGVYQYKNKKMWLVVVLLCTVLMQLIFILGVTYLIYAITGSFYFVECMAFMPLIEMISLAQPFTPNGIGVREALVAIMFKQLELSSEQLSIYIIISNMSIFVKLLGIIPVIYGFDKKHIS